METVVVVEGNDEGKYEDSGVEKGSTSLSSPKEVADPVVYKLVRVEGDGRLVPATDDEVMEVEDFLIDDKTEVNVTTDSGKTEECISSGGPSCLKLQLESSEGLRDSENKKADAEQLTSRLEEIVPSSALILNGNHNNEPRSIGECSKPADEPGESRSPASGACASSKPDFSKLKGEICLDNLSIRELHELFKATFGRETTVKDKLWLKRRIAMGLTNSCDVATTTFTIKDNKLVKGMEESCKNADGTLTGPSMVEAMDTSCKNSPTSHSSQIEDHQIVSGKSVRNNRVEFDGGSDDLQTEQRAAKRVRKPTRRYIEELSEVESRDCSPKVSSSAKNIGSEQTSPKSCVKPIRKGSSNERPVVTRLDSLGGSGVQVPYVSRVRRSRPRKNIMALMFHPSGMGMGMAAKVVKKTLMVHGSQPDSECLDQVLKPRSASEQFEPLLTPEDEKDHQCSVIDTIHLGKNLGLKQSDSSEEASDDNMATVPTAKGGMRRKHHRAWTLVEVMKLVEGVSKCGAGRWSEIKRLAFASYSYRTSVDLKDKWRNLLKASLAQNPPDDGINSRKHASVPIPAPILLRVRELAEMHAQAPPKLGSSRLAGVGGRSVHETRSGYL